MPVNRRPKCAKILVRARGSAYEVGKDARPELDKGWCVCDSDGMIPRRLMVLVVLVAWAFLGPIALAFESCGGMGAMCEGPCGSTSCATLNPAGLASCPRAGSQWVKPPDKLQTAVVKVPEPPPESVRLSA